MFCQENYLGCKTLQMIAQMKHQFAEQLASIGFLQGQIKCRDMERAARLVRATVYLNDISSNVISTRGRGGADSVATVTGPAVNANNDNCRVVSAVMCAALYPNIVKVRSS